MSRWVVVVQALHELGGVATTTCIADLIVESTKATGAGLQYAKHFGLVSGSGRSGGRYLDGEGATWTLTNLGRDYAESRVAHRNGDRSGTRPYCQAGQQKPRFIATWLSALPRDIRIEQREEEAA